MLRGGHFLLAIGQLGLDAANLLHRVVRLGEPIANRERDTRLLLPVGERRLDARVRQHLERLGADRLCRSTGKPHFVRARRHERTRDARRPENHSREARRVGVAHVPRERVHALLLATRGAGGGAEESVLGRLRGRARRNRFARVAANHLARRVEEVERDRVVRRARASTARPRQSADSVRSDGPERSRASPGAGAPPPRPPPPPNPPPVANRY